MIISKEKVNSSHWFNRILSMFLNDKLAFFSIIFLIFIVFLSILGPSLINDSFIKMNLRLRNLEPFSFEHHFMYFFGADALGRSMIARLIVATQNTIFIAGSAVFLSMTIGGVLGLISETIFGWPGIGKLMIDSILQRDFAVVQASILITAIVILSINIIIDIAYAILDPRIRHK